DLLNYVGNAQALHFNHDEPADEGEADLIAELAQDVHDWMDIYGDVDAGSRVRAGYQLTSLIQAVEATGSAVWAGRYRDNFGSSQDPLMFTVAVVVVRRDEAS